MWDTLKSHAEEQLLLMILMAMLEALGVAVWVSQWPISGSGLELGLWRIQLVGLMSRLATPCRRRPIQTDADIKGWPIPVFDRRTPMKDKDAAVTMPYGWVVISKLTELTGYSDDAIRAKKKRGDWAEGRHWRKAPDNRVIFHVPSIQAWMEGRCDA